jgi:hypothetical protein
MTDITERRIIAVAYQSLAHLPLGSMSRHRLQGTLAALRDELALLSGMSAEEIQNRAEHIATMGRDIFSIKHDKVN